jgi:ABC-type uncharacterized transport system permease subunit
MKLIVEIIGLVEKVSKFLPIIVFAYAGLTLVFAVVNLAEDNIATGIVLCIFAAFGMYLAIRIFLTRRKWKREWKAPRNTQLKRVPTQECS